MNRSSQSEEIVERALYRIGLRPERFTKNEMLKQKTPDFKVFKGAELVFYCEVKMIAEDTYLEDLLEDAEPLEIVGGQRNDPTFNRLSADIHTAFKQFKSVNPEDSLPNVLVFVNFDDCCKEHDLIETLTGNFYSDNGSVHATMKHVSEGRIREEKSAISLYIWADTQNRFHPLFLTETNESHKAKMIDIFSIPSNAIHKT